MLRKLLLIFSGSAGAAVLSLMRNLLIAAMISVENYGIAATFAMAMTVVEMLSTIGMQQQIVQSPRGNDPKFQAALQGFHLFRGVLAGLTLIVAAHWIAAFLNIPEVAWAYQVLALVPLFNGLQHFDIHRLKRQMSFLPFMLSESVPVGVSFALTWPLAVWLEDYRVMLAAIIIEMALRAGVSHLVAERPYRLSFDTKIIGGALKFGWPLLINNLLLFAVLNGEKVLTGRILGMESLAMLAMGFTLTLAPTMVLAKTIQSFFLPQLSAAQGDPVRFERLALVTLQAAILNGALVVMIVLALGEVFVTLTLGTRYADLVPLIIWLGLLNAIRVFKSGGAVVALARGQTANGMIANLFRVASLPFSAWAMMSGEGLLTVIWIATLGEILGVIASFVLVHVRASVPMRSLLPTFGAVTVMLVCVALYAGHTGLSGTLSAIAPRWVFAAAAAIALIVLVATLQEGRRYLRARTTQGFKV